MMVHFFNHSQSQSLSVPHLCGSLFLSSVHPFSLFQYHNNNLLSLYFSNPYLHFIIIYNLFNFPIQDLLTEFSCWYKFSVSAIMGGPELECGLLVSRT